MKSAVIVFPGSNCDRDMAVALEKVSGTKPVMVWHGDSQVPDVDLIVLPGGFSYGDYLRAGAMASRSPVMRDVIAKATRGTPTMGICNGFQVLTEAQLLPGVLMRNADLKFVCRNTTLKVENANTRFTAAYGAGEHAVIPVAHHDGNYFADAETLARLEGEGQVAFRYADNPNGSINDIAGVLNKSHTVMGMMPHPERAIGPELGSVDGIKLFESLIAAL